MSENQLSEKFIKWLEENKDELSSGSPHDDITVANSVAKDFEICLSYELDLYKKLVSGYKDWVSNRMKSLIQNHYVDPMRLNTDRLPDAIYDELRCMIQLFDMMEAAVVKKVS